MNKDPVAVMMSLWMEKWPRRQSNESHCDFFTIADAADVEPDQHKYCKC
jgi:hypothetical protein